MKAVDGPEEGKEVETPQEEAAGVGERFHLRKPRNRPPSATGANPNRHPGLGRRWRGEGGDPIIDRRGAAPRPPRPVLDRGA